MNTRRLVIELVQQLFEQGFNGGDIAAVNRSCSPVFCDHHPMRIPGFEPGPGIHREGISGLKQLIRFLSGPYCDVRFSIEKLISEDTLAVARLFGLAVFYGESARSSGQDFDSIAGRSYLLINGTAMFREFDGQLIERWGEYFVESI